MDCPICLEQLMNPVTFDCRHLCCQPCFIASEITHCPICRTKITTTISVSWKSADSSLNASVDSSLNASIDSIFPTLVRNTEDSLERQSLLASSLVIRSKCKEVISYAGTVVSRYEGLVKYYNDKYDKKQRKLDKRRKRKMEELKRQFDDSLQQDDNKVKQLEYYNQGLNHVADTCLALATQPPDIISQVLPLYQAKIDELSFDWPLGLSPTFPSIDLDHSSTCHVYIEKINDFVYLDISPGLRETIVLPPHTVTPRVNKVLHIVSDGNLIYCLVEPSMFRTLEIWTYDLGLNLLCTTSSPGLSFIYIHNGSLCEITRCSEGFVTQFNGAPFCFDIEPITNVVVFNNTLYVSNRYDTILTSSGESKDAKIFAKDGSLFEYSYPDNSNTIVHEHKHNSWHFPSKRPFPGCGTFFPGARNTVIYHCKGYFELIELTQ